MKRKTADTDLIHTRFIELRERIIEEIESFNDWWIDHALTATVYTLPVRAEHEAPQAIAVERLEGSAAIDLARESLTLFEYIDDQHVTAAYRLPGVVMLDAPPCRWLRRINALKRRAHRTVIEAIARQHRADFHKAVLPGQVPSQFYRRIPGLPACPKGLAFTWAGSTESVASLSPEQAKARMMHVAQRAAPDTSPETLRRSLAAKFHKVDTLGKHDAIKLREPIAPHPRVLVYPHTTPARAEADRAAGKRVRKWSQMLHANLPLFVPWHSGRRLPELTHLDDWEAAAIKPRAPRRSRGTVLCRASRLFLVDRRLDLRR